MLKLTWRISRIPELGHLDEVERRAVLAGHAGWRFYGPLIAQSLFVGGLASLAPAAMLGRSTSASMLAGLVGACLVVSAAVWYQLVMLRLRMGIRAEILRGLEGRRVPVCLRCGYDLAAATTDRCPECGAPIRVPSWRRSR